MCLFLNDLYIPFVKTQIFPVLELVKTYYKSRGI